MVMLLKGVLAMCLGNVAFADLRMASQPKKGRGMFGGGGSPMYQLANQGTVPWANGDYMHYRYMEPSTFGYAGLANQKKRNYDNFLRSNIDNEQDNRNFETEDGKDHLPFRSYEGRTYGKIYKRWTSMGRQRIQQLGVEELTKVVQPGGSLMVPFRWNNPHASEMEVNIWIFNHSHQSKHPIVVPIRKPSCSGEGHQDNVIMFTVPKDFTQLGSKIPGFKGCHHNTKPMCTLQIYSHSVESRQYAIGFPIVIPGHNSSAETASGFTGVEQIVKDPWLNIMPMRELCLPATDPSAHITQSKPRWARLASDVFTHAYMNSDYSPYSGQQQEKISRNMQASAINKMVTGNRGELGKSILAPALKTRLASLRKLEEKIYKNYETLANKVIGNIGHQMKTSGVIGIQKLAHCFRCAQVGSTNTNRLNTNTYIPSFQVPKNLVQAARNSVPQKYQGLINERGVVQVYVASTLDLLPFFYQSAPLGVVYQPAMTKSVPYGMSTMPDAAKFKKRNAQNIGDGGKYASWMAFQKLAASRGCPATCLQLKPAYQDTSKPWFCVARYATSFWGRASGSTIGPFADVKAAVTELNKKAVQQGGGGGGRGRRGRRGRRGPPGGGSKQMVCEMTKNGAKQDPRQVGGLNQGGGQRAGFQTSWANWNDVKTLNGQCAGHMGCKYNIPMDAMENPLVIGSRGTNVSGVCQPCLQFFGKKVNAMKKPKETALSKEVAKAGNGGADALASPGATLAPNPSGAEEEALIQTKKGKTTASRRRRRTEALKASKTGKKKKKGIKVDRINDFLSFVDTLQEHEDLNLHALDDVIRLPDDNCNKTMF